jgi:hypothetical protein
MEISVSVIHKNPHNGVSCRCCGKRSMKKIYFIAHDELEYGGAGFGASCISKHFGVKMTGNPHRALRVLTSKINSLRFSEVEEIINYASLKEVDS